MDGSFCMNAFCRSFFVCKLSIQSLFVLLQNHWLCPLSVPSRHESNCPGSENQSAINFNSLANHTPSKINFVCGEQTIVAVINAEKEKKLYYMRYFALVKTSN